MMRNYLFVYKQIAFATSDCVEVHSLCCLELFLPFSEYLQLSFESELLSNLKSLSFFKHPKLCHGICKEKRRRR